MVKSFKEAVTLLLDVGKIPGSRKKIHSKVLLSVVRWTSLFSRLNCSMYSTGAQQSLLSSFWDTSRISGWQAPRVPTVCKEPGQRSEVPSGNANSAQRVTTGIPGVKAALWAGTSSRNKVPQSGSTPNMGRNPTFSRRMLNLVILCLNSAKFGDRKWTGISNHQKPHKINPKQVSSL